VLPLEIRNSCVPDQSRRTPFKPGAVVLESFNVQWQRFASAEADQIAVALSGEVLEVHPIGSAAIYENETVGHPDTMGLLSSWWPAT
jgi:GrpB-like predicted nucleotidyltransferase (UPF0157 family)